MTQREGRILRQGNQNSKVSIYRYITEGSFDAYSWQLLETKQRFISDLLSGSLTERDGGDIEDTVLDYAEVKALAVGNPLVKERVETQNELSRYQSIQKKIVESRLRMEKELLELPGRIATLKEEISFSKKDAEQYRKWKKENSPVLSTAEKEKEAEQRRAFREKLNAAIKENIFAKKEKLLATYRGFEIVLPANMSEMKPYIWLRGNGRHYIEMGDTQIGNLMRIDNFLEAMDDRVEKLKKGLAKYEDRQREIQAELARNENYTDKIEELRQRVAELDSKLGVNKE